MARVAALRALQCLAVVVAGASASLAVDLSTLSSNQQRLYCVAYIFLGLTAAHEQGGLSDSDFQHLRTQLGWKVRDAQELRRIDAPIAAILAENPTLGEVATQAKACVAMLRF